MAIPTFEELLLPVLQALEGRGNLRIRDIVEQVATITQVTDDDRRVRDKSGTLKFDNRIAWVLQTLVRLGVINRPERGVYKISQEGENLLSEKHDSLRVKFLMDKYPDFVEANKQWFKPEPKKNQGQIPSLKQDPTSTRVSATPIVDIVAATEQLNLELAIELHKQIIKQNDSFFELLVVRLLEKMGYGIGEVTGRSGDGGIDGVIYEDKLGIGQIRIQAKRFETVSVGRPTLQAFVGALVGSGCDKGVFLTLSSFTKDAVEYVKALRTQTVVLINGDRLLELMIEHNLGVSIEQTIEIKKIDMDFFEPDV